MGPPNFGFEGTAPKKFTRRPVPPIFESSFRLWVVTPYVGGSRVNKERTIKQVRFHPR